MKKSTATVASSFVALSLTGADIAASREIATAPANTAALDATDGRVGSELAGVFANLRRVAIGPASQRSLALAYGPSADAAWRAVRPGAPISEIIDAFGKPSSELTIGGHTVYRWSHGTIKLASAQAMHIANDLLVTVDREGRLTHFSAQRKALTSKSDPKSAKPSGKPAAREKLRGKGKAPCRP